MNTQASSLPSTRSLHRSLRRKLVAKYGKSNYKITESGEVYVYGKMPNTLTTCWYFFGYINDFITFLKLGM